MKKWLIVLLVCCMVLGGCGKGEDQTEQIKQTEETEAQESVKDEEDNQKEEAEDIDGFEKAEYEKFNSPASENGLGGTMIYIKGKVINQINLGNSQIPILVLVVEQEDGNQWCVTTSADSEIKEIQEKNVRIFGTYQGFSDAMNLPAMAVVAQDLGYMSKVRVEMEENGEYVTVWSFLDYANGEIAKQEENEKTSESVDTEVSEEIPRESTVADTATSGEKNALRSAKDYLSVMPFSYEGLIKQLEYEKYSHEEAVYAADNCGADWNKQALESAKDYLDTSAFSYTGLIKQLEYEKYTSEQAVYAADNCGADWNEQAVKSAADYLEIMSFSRSGLIEQLEYEGFTHEQAVYGAEQNGY